MGHFWGLPLDASANGVEIDYIIVVVHWLMLVLLVGWGTYFVYCLIRFRKSKNPVASYAGVKSHISNYLEVGVAVIEGVLLVGLAFPVWATFKNEFPPENKSLTVNVVAEQFAWNIHYPGPDGVFGKRDASFISQDNPLGLDRSDPDAKDDIATINQLNLPVGKPVIVHLSSKDVIHSFGIPLMRVKQDVIPGVSIPLWFTPTQTGNFEIACSQLCGLGHYRMRGFVTVQTEEEYEAWVNEEEANQMLEGAEVK